MEAVDRERLVEVEQRCKSNTHRIGSLENNYEALAKIASSMEVMVLKQDHIAEKVDTLDGKVSGLEKLPGDRFNMIVDKVLTGVVGAIVGALCAMFFK